MTSAADGASVSGAREIKPMFGDMDRESMTIAFDLAQHGDVAGHPAEIVDALSSEKMPCVGLARRPGTGVPAPH